MKLLVVGKGRGLISREGGVVDDGTGGDPGALGETDDSGFGPGQPTTFTTGKLPILGGVGVVSFTVEEEMSVSGLVGLEGGVVEDSVA